MSPRRPAHLLLVDLVERASLSGPADRVLRSTGYRTPPKVRALPRKTNFTPSQTATTAACNKNPVRIHNVKPIPITAVPPTPTPGIRSR